MVKRLFIGLFVFFAFSVELAPSLATSKSYVTIEGKARMMAVVGIKAQWQEARQICIEEGFAIDSSEFLSCFAEYQILSIRLLGARAKELTDAVAKRHNLCIDRSSFEIARCTEI